MKSRRQERERDLWLAYHSAAFFAAAQVGKLETLGHYKRAIFGGDEQATGTAAAAFNFFSSLKARGLPIAIDRTTRH